jgi:hypothetical protein
MSKKQPKARKLAAKDKASEPVPVKSARGEAPVHVYLPDDEPDSTMFNAHVFNLEPNAATEIVSPWKEYAAKDIAQHIVDKLGKFGACLVHGPVKDGKASLKEDQAAVDAAELQYLKGTKEWAELRVVEADATNKGRTDSGLDPHPDNPETEKARTWLKKYRHKLLEAGLIAKG